MFDSLLKNYSKWVYGKNPNHKILLWGLNDFKPTNQPKIWKSSRKLARTQEKNKVTYHWMQNQKCLFCKSPCLNLKGLYEF